MSSTTLLRQIYFFTMARLKVTPTLLTSKGRWPPIDVIGGSKGLLGMPPLFQFNFCHFHAILAKILPYSRFAPPPVGRIPPTVWKILDMPLNTPTINHICSGCEQSYPDHTARKLLPGLARQTFRPDYTREEPEQRLVRTLVSVPVMLLVGLWRSGSSGSQQNTFSNSGGCNLLHPKVVDLASPYSQRHAHALWYMSTLNYNSLVGTRWVMFQ